jgi:hypothetical protein
MNQNKSIISDDYDSSSENESDDENDEENRLLALLSVIRCAAHTLQLAVYDALKNSRCANLDKIRNVIKKLKSSKYSHLKLLGLRNLKLDVVTLWNSLFLMLESLMKNRETLEGLYIEMDLNDMREIFLSSNDFQLIDEFLIAFRQTYECTLSL